MADLCRRAPRQDFFQHLLVGDLVDQPVGTQEDGVPLLHGLPEQVCLYLLGGAQSPGDQVSLGVAAGLLRGQRPMLDEFLHHGMVPGDPANGIACDTVGPAVAHVYHKELLPLHQGAHQGGAHAGIGPAGARLQVDRPVGRPDGLDHQVLLLGIEGGISQTGHVALIPVSGHGAGQVSGGSAAHTVAHHSPGVALLLLEGAGILVLGPDHSFVRQSP